MKKRVLLSLAFLLAAWASGMAATMLFTFEDAQGMDGWNNTRTIVANPLKDATNSSANCYKITNDATWGRVSYNTTFNPAQMGISFLVYAESLGDISVAVAGDNASYPTVTQSILAKNQWVRVSFNFSALTKTATQIQIGTGAVNTVYIDDVQILELSNFPASLCKGGMDVPYKYGTVAIGGGGFVSGLIASPKDKNVKFARTDVGGAYKWNAADCSWKPLNNFISSADKGLLSIEALAVDPTNSNNIYMLGGCQYFSDAKTTIMYSKDGGATFKTVDVSSLIRVHGNGNGRGNGERIAVDPNNSNILFCGGRLGSPLIKSTDGGATWSAVSAFPSSVYTTTTKWPTYDTWTTNPKMWPTTPNLNGTSAVVFDKTKVSGGATQRIFAGVSRTGAPNVYVTEDGGATWNQVNGLPTGWMPLRMKMDPDGNLLVAYSSTEGPNNCAQNGIGGIYRYNPSTKIAENISPSGNHPIGDVSCSPTNADSLVCTTICTWVDQSWGTGNTPDGDIIFTSIDGGKSWRSLQNNFQFDSNGCSWVPDHAIHWSCSILMDPFDNNKVSVTSGNGIFTTNNVWCDKPGGPTFYFDVNGLEEVVPLDFISIPGGDNYSVIGDYTGFRHKDVHQFAPIHKPESGTTGGIAYATLNTKIMVRAAHFSYYTEDGGDTWTKMAGALEVYDPTLSEIAISADGAAIVYCPAGSSSLSYSTNKGASFTNSSGATNAKYVIADPVNSNYFYAGAKNAVYVSSDKGKTFTATAVSNGDYTRVCVVPGKEGLVYVPMGGSGLGVSTDHGTTFNSVPFVTNCEAVGVGVGKTAGTYVLYIWGKANGCEVGLYRSEDNGTSWQRINDETTQFGGVGNGAFVVGDQNIYGRFYLGTVGLGIVYGELASNATAPQWNCFVDNTTCKVDNTSTTKTQTVQLYKGWNLISVNVIPADNSIKTLFAGQDVLEVKNMDAFWRKGQGDALNSLTALKVGEGYLVNMNADGKLTVTGEPFAGTYQFQASGWQLIGCPYQVATPMADVFGSNFSVVKDFEGYWIPNDPKSGITQLKPGKGYFIKK